MLRAQQSTFYKANTLFESMSYAEAIPKYIMVLKRDSTVNDALVKLAECYRRINDVKNTEKIYALIIKKGIAKPIHQFYYAQALMSLGNYTEAQKYMAAYRSDERGEAFSEAFKNLNKFFKDSAYYKVKREPFNSKFNDFSPVIWNEKLLFTSSRLTSAVVNYEYPYTEKNYFKLYITSKKANGNYTKPRRFSKYLQKKYNDGTVCFSGDNKVMYLTRNNVKNGKDIRSSDGKVNLQVYKAIINKKGNGYGYASALEINDKEYSIAHPSINLAGTHLYFSSDMPGGSGGMDLWLCLKEGDYWSKPINLGNSLNTKGNELFPTVFKNTLYFSSNGLEGIGGLDIFQVELDSNGMPIGQPINMGVPVNSPADDFGIAWNKDGKSGYFSSNRKSLNMDDDIYSFTDNKPAKAKFKIVVMDSASSQLVNSIITITDLNNNDKKEISGENGTYEFESYPDHKYAIDAKAYNYNAKNGVMFLPSSDPSPLEIRLSKVKITVFSGLVYEKGTDHLIDNALVFITNEKGDSICEKFHTDVNGKYTTCVLKPNEKFTFTAIKKGYFTTSITIGQLPANGKLENIYMDKIVIGKAIVIENIYFDYNKADIRSDAAIELDKIVKLMNENPEIIIELGSHTDCRGSAKYNLDLSDRRAKSSAAYIVSKGIDKSRITGKGYGESQLLNDCKCEGNLKSDCSEVEHQLNRRTEFKVTGFVNGIGNVKVGSVKK